MSEERSLKIKGENLAKIAVESKMGAKQLQTLYRLLKTRPLAFVEAYVQRQIGREVRGYEAFVKLLEMLKKYEDKRPQLERVLMYAVMLYDYYEQEPYMNVKSVINAIAKRVVEGHGCVFDGVEMDFDRRTVTVHVRRFHGNPKALALDIEKSFKSREELSNLNLKVWIESR